MRNLQTTDIFAGCRLVTALDLKEDIKAIALRGKEEKQSQDDLGFEILYKVFEKASQKNGEQAIYAFLSPILEMKPGEIATMDPVECIDLIVECAEVDKWKAFFTRVASLIAKN